MHGKICVPITRIFICPSLVQRRKKVKYQTNFPRRSSSTKLLKKFPKKSILGRSKWLEEASWCLLEPFSKNETTVLQFCSDFNWSTTTGYSFSKRKKNLGLELELGLGKFVKGRLLNSDFWEYERCTFRRIWQSINTRLDIPLIWQCYSNKMSDFDKTKQKINDKQLIIQLPHDINNGRGIPLRDAVENAGVRKSNIRHFQFVMTKPDFIETESRVGFVAPRIDAV